MKSITALKNRLTLVGTTLTLSMTLFAGQAAASAGCDAMNYTIGNGVYGSSQVRPLMSSLSPGDTINFTHTGTQNYWLLASFDETLSTGNQWGLTLLFYYTPPYATTAYVISSADISVGGVLTMRSQGGNSADTVTVSCTSPNAAPTANAGPDQTVASEATVTLDGTGTTDADGDTMTYAWTQTSGTSVTLSGETTTQPTFTAPTIAFGGSAATLVFSLVATDSESAASTADTVSITVNAATNTAPTANAGPDQTVASEATVTLDGTGTTDAQSQSMTYAWTQTSGTSVTLSDATATQPTFTAPTVPYGASAATLVFSLVATDSESAASTADTVSITVNAATNTAPTANAGPDQTVASEATVTLDGTGTTDAQSQSMTYAWTQTSGTSVTLSDATATQPTFTAPTIAFGGSAATLVFSLVANDGTLNSSADTVSITVNPSTATPQTEFDANNAAIKNIITDEAVRSLQSSMRSNEQLVDAATARFIQNRNADDGNISMSSGSYVPFDIDGSADYVDGKVDVVGDFFQQAVGLNGKYTQQFFGDFSMHKDVGSSTTAQINGKLVREYSVSSSAMLAYYVGGSYSQSNVEGDFTGTQNSVGLTAGAYFVKELQKDLYADGFVSIEGKQYTLNIDDGTLDLSSDYSTLSSSLGASVTGVIEKEGYDLWPQVSFTYGQTNVGTVGFTGVAHSQTDSTLSLDAGTVSLATLKFIPEVRIPLEIASADYDTMFNITPTLLCNWRTVGTTTESCGQGIGFELVSASLDGLTNLSVGVQADQVGNTTSQQLQLNVERKF